MKRFCIQLSVIVFSLTLFSAFAQTGELDNVHYATELWTATFEKDVVWQQLTDAGYLVVCTDDGLYGIDPATGKTAWQMDDVKKLPEDFFEILPGTQFAAVVKKTGPLGVSSETILVDIIEGKVLWTSKTIGIANSSGQFFIPELGAVMVYGLQEKSMKPITVLAELASGKPIWSSLTLFKKGPELHPIRPEKKTSRLAIGGNQNPLYLPDGNFLEFISPNGLRKINAATGEVIWKAAFKYKDIPGLRKGYAPIALSPDGQVAYVPHDNTVEAVNTSDGQALWKKAPKLLSPVNQMAVTPQGLVVRGGAGPDAKPYITVLDLQSGATAWKKPFRDMKGASSFAIKDDNILLYADKSIFKINLADASAEEIVKKIEFEGGEIPSTLEQVEGGYLLISSQNLALYDPSGKQVYHNFHKAPGASLFAKIASTAAIAAVNAASAASAHQRAYETGRDQKYDIITSNPTMSKRFKASAQAANYTTVLCNVEGGGSGSKANAGLIKINKLTGVDEKRVALATKEPKYEIDGIENRLFFLKDDHTIVCYDF